MEEENYQKELFEFEKPKKTFPGLSNIFQKADFEGRLAITLTLEKIIFISIAVIMIMVVIYAAGVERGKRSSGKTADIVMIKPVTTVGTPAISQSVKAPQFLSTAQVAPSRERPLTQKNVIPAVMVAPKVKASVGEKAAPSLAISQDKTKPYTIIAVTFTRKDTAAQEANRLRREGFDANVIESYPYFQVTVGAYPDKDSAQSKRSLSKIKQFYKDAYFKLR